MLVAAIVYAANVSFELQPIRYYIYNELPEKWKPTWNVRQQNGQTTTSIMSQNLAQI